MSMYLDVWTNTKMFHVYVCFQDQSLREEVVSLRLRLSEKEQALKDALDRVKSSDRTKDSMEHFIVSQRESLMFLISLVDHIKPYIILRFII